MYLILGIFLYSRIRDRKSDCAVDVCGVCTW